MILHETTIGDCTMYLGDALEIMPLLYGRANCVMTDPPYKLTSGGATAGGMHERMGGGEYDNGGSIVDCDLDWTDFMPHVAKLVDRGHVYVMANNRHLANCENAALAAGLRFHNWLIWDKRTAVANRWYMKNAEFCGLFFAGNAMPINNCSCKQLVSMPQVDETSHPTEKPVMLMRYWIENSTRPGDLVIDPFAGTGTTGVACMQGGRRFIGIEKSPKWYEVAVKRLKLEAKTRLASQAELCLNGPAYND